MGVASGDVCNAWLAKHTQRLWRFCVNMFFCTATFRIFCALNYLGKSVEDSSPITYKDLMMLSHQFSPCPSVPLPNQGRRVWFKSGLPESESGHSPGWFNQLLIESKKESIKRLKPRHHDESVSHKFKLECIRDSTASSLLDKILHYRFIIFSCFCFGPQD